MHFTFDGLLHGLWAFAKRMFGCVTLWLASAAVASASCLPGQIDIRTDAGVHSYQIEVVDTYETRAQGLMHRTDLAVDEGMLFVYERASQVAFWMKNTPLPLDIIFINRRGIVCSIAANTTPYSRDNIPSRCAAQTVLEVNLSLIHI